VAEWNAYNSEALETCNRPALLYLALERMWRHNLVLNKYLIIFLCQTKGICLRIGQADAVWPGFIMELQGTESCPRLYSLSWSRNLSPSMECEGLLVYCVDENWTLSCASWIQSSLTSYVSKILFNVTHQFMRVPPKSSLHLTFSELDFVCFITTYYLQHPSLLKYISLNEVSRSRITAFSSYLWGNK